MLSSVPKDWSFFVRADLLDLSVLELGRLFRIEVFWGPCREFLGGF